MSERRIGWLLVALLVGQLVVLAIQVPGPGGAQDTYLESVGLRLVGPLARLVSASARGVSGAGEGLSLRRRLVAENRELRQEVESLKLELMRLRDVEHEMDRLAAVLDYAVPPVGRIRPGDVVYVDHASWLRTLVLYTGGRPARVDQPVLAPEGLVGRVVVAAGPYAKAQIVTDRAASVGAMIARNRRQGIVRGSGSGLLELDYVPVQADVRVGDRVLTAGIDGIYPRGIPIGTVTGVEPGGQLFHRIEVAPAVAFGTLDQVYLLEHERVPQEVKEAVPGALP